ncbi:MAG: 30S ribosomal protein S1 [Bacteroidia bacterium]|nr:30S ribosomal protein S1 [Bacteroidia bacterium]
MSENTPENPETNVENTTTEAPVAEQNNEETTAKTTEAPVQDDTEADSAPESVEELLPRHTNMVVSSLDFDWDAEVKSSGGFKNAAEEQMAARYEKTLNSVNEHEVVEGTIMAMTAKDAVVNISYKSDGVVPVSELRYNPEIKIGDTIEVYIESKEDKGGQLLLSHKKARSLKSWDRVNTALENDEIIKGYVKCRTKGGLIVDVFGIEAFLPGSQIDVKPIRDYDIYVGKSMEFKVVKINKEFKNVVVSHKALIEEELEQQKTEIIAKLEKGQVLEGTVKNITSYGVFIDLGGVDGLIHITDLSWGRINHPEEIVQLDEKIQVVILDFDEGKKRIALGLKQLTPHPWDNADANLQAGDKVKGKVVVLADYGAFVEITPGFEGLVHVSEMSWSQHLRSAQDFLKVGDDVECVVLSIDREERKMSLGIKQLMPDPWADIEFKYPTNSRHQAKVRNFTNFGVFVELEEGVDGLIHISDLSWSKKIKHPSEFTKVGESIEVVVLDIDKENRRLSLGHKQLEENPWDVFETIFNEGSVHTGTITSVNDKGAVVALPYGLEGFAPTKHLVKADGSTAKTEETLEFKVIEFSKENKKIIVSHARTHEEAKPSTRKKGATGADSNDDGEDTKKAVKKIKDNLEKSTLGDLSVLSNLKSSMEKSEKAAAEKKLSKAKKEKEEEGDEA